MPLRPRTNPKAKKSSGGWGFRLIIALITLLLLFLLIGILLWKSGNALVHNDAFEHRAWAVVLAGESRNCERSEASVKLFLEGRIDSLILSATPIYKTHYGSEYIREEMIKAGYSRNKLFEFHQDAYSTFEEATLILRQARLMQIDTLLVITSNFHSARSAMIFKKLANGNPVIQLYGAEFSSYEPNAWWSDRNSRKTWLEEWLRFIYAWFEIRFSHPKIEKAESDRLIPSWSRANNNIVTTPKIDSSLLKKDSLKINSDNLPLKAIDSLAHLDSIPQFPLEIKPLDAVKKEMVKDTLKVVNKEVSKDGPKDIAKDIAKKDKPEKEPAKKSIEKNTTKKKGEKVKAATKKKAEN